MPPTPLIDLERVDTTSVLHTKSDIYGNLLPHAHEFELLSGVTWCEHETQEIVTFVDVTPDAWWVKGHVPGNPLLPGVLQLEMAAQTSAILAKIVGKIDAFIAFGGVGDCKFREAVIPPAKLIILCKGKQLRSRRVVTDTQGIVDGKIMFEAEITGLVMR